MSSSLLSKKWSLTKVEESDFPTIRKERNHSFRIRSEHCWFHDFPLSRSTGMDGKEYSELSKKTGYSDIRRISGKYMGWRKNNIRLFFPTSGLQKRSAPKIQYDCSPYKTYEKTRYSSISPVLLSASTKQTQPNLKDSGNRSSIARMIVNYRKKLGAFIE